VIAQAAQLGLPATLTTVIQGHNAYPRRSKPSAAQKSVEQ
jgi:hypothetical protein